MWMPYLSGAARSKALPRVEMMIGERERQHLAFIALAS
jgi:hypothetical protein